MWLCCICLQSFQEQAGACVFLLSSSGTSVAGLNLTTASQVFIMEPQLSPQAEQQAVARAHRLGQTQPVTVTHLLIHVSCSHGGGATCSHWSGGMVLIAMSLVSRGRRPSSHQCPSHRKGHGCSIFELKTKLP